MYILHYRCTVGHIEALKGVLYVMQLANAESFLQAVMGNT